MRLDPFTLEEYQGDIVETTCDSCDNPTTYEQCAYGTDVLVICDDCSSTYTEPEDDEDNQSIQCDGYTWDQMTDLYTDIMSD